MSGNFVKTKRGVGKKVSTKEGSVVVEFFDYPGTHGRIKEEFPEQELTTYALEPETRVWWHDGERWLAGLVLGLSEDDPAEKSWYINCLHEDDRDNRHSIWEDYLYVRWDQPMQDPVQLLASRISFNHHEYNNRRRFMEHFSELESASGGLTGIVSSSVELFPHQVTAARKVLLDPLKRYLLADEVGLGKTMEVGMIMRQLLQDREGSNVLVLAPDSLVAQWDKELESKFGVFGLNGAHVVVRGHSILAANAEEIKKDFDGIDSDGFDLLVVDEAHQVVSQENNEACYERLSDTCFNSDWLLLLTATPVSSNEDAFLRLLHLLDPGQYPIDNDGFLAFKNRVKGRREIAGAMQMLNPEDDEDDDSFYFQDLAMKQIEEVAIQDEWMKELISKYRDCEPSEKKHVLAQEIKIYLSETYRIHRRMIRTRRNKDTEDLFPVRRRAKSHNWIKEDNGPERSEIVQILENFRAGLGGNENIDQKKFLQVVGERMTSSSPAILGLYNALTKSDMSDVAEDEKELLSNLSNHSLGEELVDEIKRVKDSLEEIPRRIKIMAEWAWSHVDRKEKGAVFTSFTSVAEMAYEEAIKKCGPDRVAKLISGMTEDEESLNLEKIISDPLCVVLICDRSAEVGRNLQFIHNVLHLDIPWSTNRLEQRLGRFDRYIHGSEVLPPIKSTVFCDSPELNSISGCWMDLLDKGFGVFEKSSASLQYILPKREKLFLEKAIDFGFRAASSDWESESEEIQKERIQIEIDDDIDSSKGTENDEDYFTKLAAVDKEYGHQFGLSWSNLVSKQLKFRHSGYDKGQFNSPPWTVSYSPSWPPRLPRSVVHELNMSEVSELSYQPNRMKLNSKTTVLRPGDPFTEKISGLIRNHESGSATATFIGVPNLSETQWEEMRQQIMYFEFVLVLGPALSAGFTKQVGNETFDRQCRRYLPLRVEKIWIKNNQELDEISLERVKKELRKPQSDSPNKVDLSTKFGLFQKATQGYGWEDMCREVEESAKKLVSERAEVIQYFAQGVQKVKEDMMRTNAQLGARETFLGEKVDFYEENKNFEEILGAVAEPEIRVDSCSVVLFGPESWL